MTKGLSWETMREQTARLGRVGMWAPGSYICKCIACERQFEGDKRSMNCLPCAVSRLSVIADRLTVEGLAGVIFETLPERSAWNDAEWRENNVEDERISNAVAQALLEYITAPSGELSDGIPGSSSTAASSSAMASDSGQVKP